MSNNEFAAIVSTMKRYVCLVVLAFLCLSASVVESRNVRRQSPFNMMSADTHQVCSAVVDLPTFLDWHITHMTTSELCGLLMAFGGHEDTTNLKTVLYVSIQSNSNTVKSLEAMGN